MADQDPKITLLRSKLALLMGREECPVYDSIKAQHPHALEEPWSEDMSGPHKRVGRWIAAIGRSAVLRTSNSLTYEAIVFNNKTFAMHQVLTQEEAYKRTFQPHAINCGENIKLHRQ